MKVNNELTMTKLSMHSDVYALMSCLSLWLQSLPTKRLKQAKTYSSYLNRPRTLAFRVKIIP